MPSSLDGSDLGSDWVDTVRGGAIDVLIAGTLLVGCAGGLWLSIGTVTTEPSAGLWAMALVVLAVFTGRRLRRTLASPIDVLVGWLIGLGFVLRLGYVLLAEEPAISDFGNMWRFALQFTSASATEPPTNIEHLRALPFLVPMTLLSRTAYAYQIGNCALLALTSLLAYRLVRRHLGSSAGALGVLFLTLAPEPLLAAEIPSHDIPGTLFLLSALVLLDRLDRDDRPSRRNSVWLLGPALGLGVVVFLLDLQRGLAPFLLVAAGVTTLVPAGTRSLSRSARRAVLMLLLPVGVLALSNLALDDSLGISSREIRERHRWLWIAAYGSSGVSGTFPELGRMWSTYSELTTPELRTFALARTASDFADRPAARVHNYVYRASSLHQLGSQLEFYLPVSTADRGAGSLVSRLTRRLANPVTVGTRLFLLTATFAGLILLLIRRGDRPLEVALVTLAVLVASLSLLGERQPRYLFPYWFVMTPVAALPFVTDPAVLRSAGISWRRLATAGLFALGIVVLAGIASLAVDRRYEYGEGRLLPVGSAQIIGTGRLIRDYTVRFDPDSGLLNGLLIRPPAEGPGEFAVLVRADSRPVGCRTVVRVSGPGRTLVSLEAGEGSVVRSALPIDTVLTEPVSLPGSRACPVELAFPRYRLATVRRQGPG